MKSTYIHTIARLIFLTLFLSVLGANATQIIGGMVAMFLFDVIVKIDLSFEEGETDQMIISRTYQDMGQMHKKFVLPELRIPASDLDATAEVPPFRLIPLDALPSKLPPSPSESDWPLPSDTTLVPPGPNDLEVMMVRQTMPETPSAFLAHELEIRLLEIKKKEEKK